MAFSPIVGHVAAKQVLDALGIPAAGVTRIVIDFQVNHIATVYVTKHLPAESVPSVAESVKGADVIEADVTVDEKGNIKKLPKPAPPDDVRKVVNPVPAYRR